MKLNARFAERAPAALVYVALRNFTRLCGVLPPEQVLQLASEFFTAASGCLKLHGGELCSIENDSVLAAFRTGAPEETAARALGASQELLREFAPTSDRWQTDYGFPAALAFGIHVGETTFGMAGPRGGEQYIAFGDSVSVAQHLVQRARAGEIVLSQAAMRLLGEEEAEPLPALKLGRRPPMPLYGILLDTRLDFT